MNTPAPLHSQKAVRRIAIPSVLTLLCLGGATGLLSNMTTRADDDPPPPAKASQPLTVDAARERAELLKHVYTSTLHVIHRKYFHGDRAVVPARAMEDVFEDMESINGSKARWFAVNLKPMSLNHEAKTDFEKHAAREIKKGKRDVEIVEDGHYRKAVAISLGGGCLTCHDGFLRQSSPTPKFAGLAISIPLTKPESKSSDQPDAEPDREDK